MTELEIVQKKIGDLKDQQAQAKGRKAQLMDSLKTHGCNSLEEGKAMVETLKKAAEEKREQANKKEAELYEKYPALK